MVDISGPKYKILLEFVNKILINLDKEEITDLAQFQNIDRLDIIKPCNIVVLNNMAPTIFKHFNKKKCNYYRKTKSMVLNVIRGMCKELGVSLHLDQRKISERINNRSYIRTNMFYTIKYI